VALAAAIGLVAPILPASAAVRPPPPTPTTQTLVDTARQRTLPTTFWFVRARRPAPLPVLVFVHGYDQTPSDYHRLITTWAQAGYLVVAPTFPGTGHNAPGGLDATDYRNEPADVSFVITQVLALGASAAGPLAGRVDPARVAVAGHSLGAEVVLGLLNRCCREPRLVAAVSLAGSEQFNPGVPAFPKAGYFADATVPLLLVHGDADTENPYDRSVTAYAGASPPKFFVTLHGVGHRTPFEASPASDATARAVARTTVDFLDAYLKHDARALARLAHDANVANVASLQAAPG
jgi:alpha-beta hydrolase superfamily lysophospholipase